ncbi:DinB family protein [Flavitalea flava]
MELNKAGLNKDVQGELKKELEAAIKNTVPQLLQTVSSFNEEQFNRIPFEGSWTAGQVGEHMVKFTGADILYGPVETTHRPIDERDLGIKELFLNFDIKMKSPDFILPTGTYHKKEEILHELENKWKEVSDAVQTLDLSETCTAFKIPGIGALTRLEWIRFMIYHTQRHIHQLKKIYSYIL